MSHQILVINSGSSSIKYCLYGRSDDNFSIVEKGYIERLGNNAQFHLQHGKHDKSRELNQDCDHHQAVRFILDRLEKNSTEKKPLLVGHRLVHGGTRFTSPVQLDDDIIMALQNLAGLAPLHLPYNLAAIIAFRKQYPSLPQVACFDTAFHAGHDKPVTQYGLPGRYYNEGIRRYSFHGLSYEYIAEYLKENDKQLYASKVLVAHLGNGSSICAMHNGVSIDSSMGFSTLDGLLMGTRCGSLDPGVILYLLQEEQMQVKDIEHLLYTQSGLLGVSDIGNDMRDLLESDQATAREAIELYIYRFIREAGSLINCMQGLDGLVFTGGVGENAFQIREQICNKLAWLGIELDIAANSENRTVISKTSSSVKVCVIPANEELIIAKHTYNTLTA